MDTSIIFRDKYFDDVKLFDKEVFCNIYKYSFLIKYDNKYDLETLIDTKAPTVFNTAITLEDILSDNNLFIQNNNIIAIYPIVKTKSNPFIKKITIGRASIHDIIIKDTSISKFHAYFQINENNNYFLVDNSSTNGTKVNNNQLLTDEPIFLKDNDEIMFSNIRFIFSSANNLYDTIKKV